MPTTICYRGQIGGHSPLYKTIGSRSRKRCSLAASRFLVLLIVAPTMASAAPPEVTAISPTGGQQGTTVKLALQGKIDAEKLQLWCNRPGVELAGPDGKEAVELKIAADAPTGWCWLGFYNSEGAAAQRPFFIGGVPEQQEDEPNNRVTEANKAITTPVVMNGVLRKSGDVDSFSVTLTAGQTLVASLTARQDIDSPFDALLQVADARGFVVEQCDDIAGTDPQLAFRAPSDGVYVVRVFGFPGTPDSSIRFSGGSNYIYRLTLTTGAFVDRTFPVAVQADVPLRVVAEGWNLPSGAEIDVPALPAGVHEVSATGWLSTARVFTTPWPVTVATAENSRARPQTVSLPACVSGRIAAPQAEQAWKFAAKKDEKLALRATARVLGSPLDVVLRIVDAKGQTLQEVDDAVQDRADVVVDFTAPADGEYVAIVRDRFTHGGPEFTYALTIGSPQPEFVLSIANDAYTLTPEKDFELPVNVESRGGFDEEIQISLEGLPDGCSAEPVKITPQASSSSGRSGRSGRRSSSSPSNSAKLVIKTTKTDGWIGDFRVVGRTAGDAPVERVAVGKPPNTDRPRPTLRAVLQVKAQ